MIGPKKLTFLLLIPFALIFSSCTSIIGPQKAGLQVKSANGEASVFLNDQYLDKTPLINKELKPGEYIIKIQPEDQNLVSYESKISLKKGLLTVVVWKPGDRSETSGGVIYEAEKSPNKDQSQLSIISIPDRAILSLDGGDKTFSPILIENVESGHHDFELSLPSYESQKHTINVLPGYRMLVTVKLAKQDYSDTTQTDEAQEQEASDSAKVSSNIDGPKVLIKPTGLFIEGTEVLRVRDKVGGKELGFANVGEEYKYLEEKKQGWLKIEFEGQEAWISQDYAAIEE